MTDVSGETGLYSFARAAGVELQMRCQSYMQSVMLYTVKSDI